MFNILDQLKQMIWGKSLDPWHIQHKFDEIRGNTEVNIIDTCIDFSHKSLRGKCLDSEYVDLCTKALSTKSLYNRVDYSKDAYYIHGTCIAGVIGSKKTIVKNIGYKFDQHTMLRMQGIAEDVKFNPIPKLPNLHDTSNVIYSPSISTKSGVPYFPKINKIQLTIVNLSGGHYANRQIVEWIEILKDLCKNKVDHNIIVAGAGNDGENLDDSKSKALYPAALKYVKSYPQDCNNNNIHPVISVAAINKEGELYSNSNYGKLIDIAAPGVGISCPVPGNAGRIVSGTSEATAVVTGTIALLKGCKPYSSGSEILYALFKTADKNPKLVNKVKDGRVLNIQKAVEFFCFDNYDQDSVNTIKQAIIGEQQSITNAYSVEEDL